MLVGQCCVLDALSAVGISVFAISPGLVHTSMTEGVRLFADVSKEDWQSAPLAGQLCAFLATGKADRLSGRYLHVVEDAEELVRRADEIVAEDSHALRLRG